MSESETWIVDGGLEKEVEVIADSWEVEGNRVRFLRDDGCIAYFMVCRSFRLKYLTPPP